MADSNSIIDDICRTYEKLANSGKVDDSQMFDLKSESKRSKTEKKKSHKSRESSKKHSKDKDRDKHKKSKKHKRESRSSRRTIENDSHEAENAMREKLTAKSNVRRSLIKATKMEDFLRSKGHATNSHNDVFCSDDLPLPSAVEDALDPEPEPDREPMVIEKRRYTPSSKESTPTPRDLVPRNLKVRQVTELNKNLDNNTPSPSARGTMSEAFPTEESPKKKLTRLDDDDDTSFRKGQFQPVSTHATSSLGTQNKEASNAKSKKAPGIIKFGDLKASATVPSSVMASVMRFEDGEIPASHSSASESDGHPSADEHTEGEIDEPDEPALPEFKPVKAKKEKKKKLKKKRPRQEDSDEEKQSRDGSESRSKKKRRKRSSSMKRSKRDKRDAVRSRSRSDERRSRRPRSPRRFNDYRSRHPSRRRRDSRSRSRRKRSRSRSWSPMRFSYSRNRREATKTTVGDFPWSRGNMKKRNPRRNYTYRRRSLRRSSSSYSRSRSRSRSSSSARSGKLNESEREKLYKIARRNVEAMLQSGTLQQIREMSYDEIARLRAGGKSVEELVEYCRNLAAKAAAESSTDSDEDGEPKPKKQDEEEEAFRHPFVLKPQAGIVLNIPNATPMPVKTPQERALEEAKLKTQFPVSSGQEHRYTESKQLALEWKPVEREELPKGEQQQQILTAVPIPASSQAATMVLNKPITEMPSTNNTAVPAPPPPAPAVKKSFDSQPTGPASSVIIPPPPSPPKLDPDKLFDQPVPVMSIGDVVSNRLKAIRKLQENPNDSEALKLMHESENQMKNWAESKNIPGAFHGTTGVTGSLLTPDELGPNNPRAQVWAKKDQLTSTKPVESGVGMHLLKKMGWNPGEGLGKNKEGQIHPLLLDVKADRKGLVAYDEIGARPGANANVKVDWKTKHPVSALMEICARRRWNPPAFTCLEIGPPHSRRFLWKLVVNGVEYAPATPINNKKLAKSQSATLCLQSLGVIPRDDKTAPIVIG